MTLSVIFPWKNVWHVGSGPCLACVCQSKDKDAHSKCEQQEDLWEGPVFLAEEVEI